MTENNIPLVSIGMPVYNGEKYIRQALDSLLAQDYENFELIISDNASTDETGEICREYAARDSRISYYRNEENLGAVWNFNRVLDLAQGEYFMWAACDDLWESNYVSTLLGILLDNPNVILAFCNYDNINPIGTQIRRWSRSWQATFNHPQKVIQLVMFAWARIWESQKANHIYGLMNRSIILQKAFIQDNQLLASGDIFVVFTLLTLGDFGISDNLMYHKRYTRVPGTPRIQRPNEYLRFIRANHSHMNGMRRVIEASSLSIHERIIVLAVITLREIAYIFEGLFRLVFGFIILRPLRKIRQMISLALPEKAKNAILSLTKRSEQARK